MRLTLLESDRNFFKTAEFTFVSLLAHAGLVWFAVTATQGGRRLPIDEREARVFFLLPPDRVNVRARQSEILQWGKLGGDPENGMRLVMPGEGWVSRTPARGARKKGERNGARGQLPFGPPTPYIPDTAYSVLQVDEIVRYEGSAAPVYPPELLAIGAEGLVQTTYVVDTTGMIDTTTFHVILSNDPRFTQSVRNALPQMRFRPAIRSGRKVRQLVEQKFRFLVDPSHASDHVS